MKTRLVFVLCAAVVVLGCDVRASLYPVQGPLSKQSPAVTYAAKIEGFNGPGKTISVSYRDGEVLSGNWEIVPGARASKGATATSAPVSDNPFRGLGRCVRPRILLRTRPWPIVRARGSQREPRHGYDG